MSELTATPELNADHDDELNNWVFRIRDWRDTLGRLRPRVGGYSRVDSRPGYILADYLQELARGLVYPVQRVAWETRWAADGYATAAVDVLIELAAVARTEAAAIRPALEASAWDELPGYLCATDEPGDPVIADGETPFNLLDCWIFQRDEHTAFGALCSHVAIRLCDELSAYLRSRPELRPETDTLYQRRRLIDR